MRKRKGTVVVPSHGGEFPKDPESRLESLLVALHAEPKQVLTLTCLNRSWQSARDLWYRWKALELDWLPSTSTLSCYCQYSLVPRGLAQVHHILYQDTQRPVRRYRLSEEGMLYGRKAAALMLQYGMESEHSLSVMLGQTSSSGGTRSPSNRVNLLRLLHSGVKGTKESMEELDLDDVTVRAHRLALRSVGFIKYEPKVGGAKPEIQIAHQGEIFLRRLITPLYLFCGHGASKGLEDHLSALQSSNDIDRQYIINGIRQYQSASRTRKTVRRP